MIVCIDASQVENYWLKESQYVC